LATYSFDYSRKISKGHLMTDIMGTPGNDTLNGTSAADTITGLTGNDTLSGGDGNDTLDGGQGDDMFNGGAGDDQILGFHGNDTAIYAGNFSDYSIAMGSDAQGGFVRITGLGAFAGDGTDTLRYVETIVFADGPRQLGVDANNRPVLGQPGIADQALIDSVAFAFNVPATTFIELDPGDVLSLRATLDNGSPLPSWLAFDPVARQFSGTAPFSAAGTVFTVRVFASDQDPGDPGYEISDSFEIIVREGRGSNITGTDGDDMLLGTFRGETMIGQAGNDIFIGSAGADRIDGGAAGPADLVDYSASPQGVYTNLQNGIGSGGHAEGDYLIQIEDIIGSAFDDHLVDTDGQGDIRGGNGNDYIAGRLGGDRLTGGGGADIFGYLSRADSFGDSSVFRVPAGNNSFSGSAGDRITDFTPGTDRLDLSLINILSSAVSVTGNITRLTLTTPDGEMAIEFDGVFTLGQLLDNQVQRQSGDSGDNMIPGTDDFDRIFALEGNDIVNGLTGDDILSGGGGNDQLSGGGGNDSLYGGTYGGAPAEVTGNDRLEGGSGGDELYGGDGDDILDGGSGSDFMSGELGDDIYYSDTESDIIRDDGGNDTLVLRYLPTFTTFVSGDGGDGGGIENIVLDFAGATNVFGGSGNNSITGNDSRNLLNGDSGDDIMYGRGGDDQLNGGNGADVLDGGDGNDTIDGGAGTDRMAGGAGNDFYVVDGQSDLIFEATGGGIDSVGTSTSFYLYANVENLTLGGGSNDHFFGVGNDLNNDIGGNAGDNLLLGGGGDDILGGGAGTDALFGEGGADRLRGNQGIDYLVGGTGNDRLFGDDDADALYGEDGDDYLEGGTSFHTDILVGGGGNDILFGISGQTDPDYDLMDGGSGDDDYYVDTGADLTFEAAGGGTDTVYANVTVPNAGVYLYANVENLVLQGTTAFGVGNELGNQLTGSDSGNYLLGGAGNDIIDGRGGNDVLFGEGGNDVFVFALDPFRSSDVIGDFARGQDRIDLSTTGLSFAQLRTRFTQVGNDGAIQFAEGNVLVLHNVTMSQLTASDFILAPVAEVMSKDMADIGGAFARAEQFGPIDAVASMGSDLQRWQAIYGEPLI
jgi:Ca2+-binding RTX toxin-like protein